jgi:hypothetical protein
VVGLSAGVLVDKFRRHEDVKYFLSRVPLNQAGSLVQSPDFLAMNKSLRRRPIKQCKRHSGYWKWVYLG